jgi:hypothetical protein
LWNRSLVMMDIETGSLWSHILGEAMQGELKGTQLESLPCDMVTWDAWLREHPRTTVLNLSRSKQPDYTKEFYKQPERFVLGFTGNYGIQHCSFTTLIQHPLLNADARGLPLLIAFDPESTSARIFSRKLDDKQLTFAAHKNGHVRDDQTGSIWNRATGIAVEGPLQGKRLEPHVGIMSYTRAWLTFHPDSKEITSAAAPPKRDGGEPLKSEPKGEP